VSFGRRSKVSTRRGKEDDGKEDDGKGKGKMITVGGDGGVGLSRDARETNARC
jgi:hypothetical protein